MEKRIRKKRKAKVVTRSVRVGLVIFFCAIVVIFAGLLVKIYMLNIQKGNQYKKQVLAQQTYVNKTLTYRRGEIKDRNQTTLAVSSRVFNVIIEPRTIRSNARYYEPTLKAIETVFGVKRDVIAKIISENPNSLYEKVTSLIEIQPSKVDAFKAYAKESDFVKGVSFEETYIRKYPLSTVASDVIGFSSKDNIGSYGVEEKYNEELNGIAGREFGYFDSDMKLQRTVKKATNGNNIILTIDANVQKIAEKHIADFQKKTGAENVAVMMMNPKTGEILAMASDPVYNLNSPRDLSTVYTKEELATISKKDQLNGLMRMWGNYCISTMYEPGSTFKPFTVAAALEESIAKDGQHYFCDGREKVADRTIKCSHVNGHGDLTLGQVLMQSCNDAIMQIVAKLGRSKFSEYNDIFGFGKKTGVDLPGEASGLIFKKEQLNPVELATSGFGQTQTVTMVQMLAGYCSLINDGNYYEPHIVKEIQNDAGSVVETVEPLLVKKTITEKTSKLIRNYMLETVKAGTAVDAAVKGYEVGGKTGTAEKRPVEKKNYLLSFIGGVPAKDPEVAVYVIIDQPHVKDQDHSTYATKFASALLKETLPFLGVYAK